MIILFKIIHIMSYKEEPANAAFWAVLRFFFLQECNLRHTHVKHYLVFTSSGFLWVTVACC